ncbi:hypothetical protein AB0H71_05190 [Nocardia sp. NPDC050697]|uniref:hypothetical protein n=1 Tax=Nocardia sp. NPDC050697 TaxID=3155158 RepID=UPI0033F5B099
MTPPSHGPRISLSWSQVVEYAETVALDHIEQLSPGVAGVLHVLAPGGELGWFTAAEAGVYARLADLLATYAETDVVAVWLIDSAGVRHRGQGSGAEVRVRARGWDPEVGSLTYHLVHESWWATPDLIERPALTLHREAVGLVWEIEFSEHYFEAGGRVRRSVELRVPGEDFGALAELPAPFWSAAEQATGIEQIRAVAHRYGATDSTVRVGPGTIGSAADHARQRARFWAVLADATAESDDGAQHPGTLDR